MIHIGVSGTKKGMSDEQMSWFRMALGELVGRSATLHHGDCVGVDVQAHAIWVDAARPITVHPPLNDWYRAHANGTMTTILPPKSYRARNQDIVDASDGLWAFPEGAEADYPRSGTWMTIRMARRAKPRLKTIDIVFPDGSVIEE